MRNVQLKAPFDASLDWLDRFHAKEHLSAVGKVLFSESEAGSAALR